MEWFQPSSFDSLHFLAFCLQLPLCFLNLFLHRIDLFLSPLKFLEDLGKFEHDVNEINGVASDVPLKDYVIQGSYAILNINFHTFSRPFLDIFWIISRPNISE